MKSNSRILKVGLINLIVFLFGVIGLELAYGRWLKVKTFVPNILSEQGISHDLSLLGRSWGLTQRIPDKNGAVFYSLTGNSGVDNRSSKCSTLVLGGSTSEERILNRNETWTYRLFRGLNNHHVIQSMCPDGMNITNAAVNGHSIVANYFDIIYWISRFKRSYSTAVVYQGINDFQGEILEKADWYDLHWQRITFGLRYNSIFARLFESFLGRDFKWLVFKADKSQKDTVLITPYKEDLSEWKDYSIDPMIYDRLSIGLASHGRYISLVADELKKLGVSHIIWITQTKPFCKLRDMPHDISVKGSKTTQAQLDNLLSLEGQALRSWLAHDRLGDCIRLGLIRSSYLRSSSKISLPGMSSTVIDYGSLTEKSAGSYDDYHKDPAGSLLLWKDFVRMGLLRSIIEHLLQLPSQ